MIYIAHRGNLHGPNPERENSPGYIDNAIDWGFQVEVDLWYQDSKWVLGHDAPQYEIDFDFLLKRQRRLWVHCKSFDAFAKMIDMSLFPGLNFFYHTDEDYVMTSQMWIWAYPGQPGNKRTVCVMPEWTDKGYEGFGAVCSDLVGDMRRD